MTQNSYFVLGGLFDQELRYGGFCRVAKLSANPMTEELLKSRQDARETHVHLFIESTTGGDGFTYPITTTSTKIMSIEDALQLL